MFIKLTNATKEHRGKPLVINARHVMSVFPAAEDGKPVTVIYGVTQNSWSVKETVDVVLEKLRFAATAAAPDEEVKR